MDFAQLDTKEIDQERRGPLLWTTVLAMFPPVLSGTNLSAKPTLPQWEAEIHCSGTATPKCPEAPLGAPLLGCCSSPRQVWLLELELACIRMRLELQIDPGC